MGQAIRGHFGDGSKFGVKIEYIDQKSMLGTGNAASIAEPYIDQEFVLIYGDLLFAPDAIKVVLREYEKNRPSAVMAVVLVDKPESYGIIELDNQKNFKRIIEKPKREEAPSNLANAGLYVFSREIFDALQRVKQSIRGEWELTDAVTTARRKNCFC